MDTNKINRKNKNFKFSMLVLVLVISVLINGIGMGFSYQLYQDNLAMQEKMDFLTSDFDASQEMISELSGKTTAQEQTILQLQTQLQSIKPAGVPSKEKVVYLTFDDGPSALTPKILDVLKKMDVKATFFVKGSAAKNHHDILNRMLKEGHVIGNHSYSHTYEYVYKSLDNFKNDWSKANMAILEATGVETKLFRHPGGSSNTIHKTVKGEENIMPKTFEFLKEQGVVYFDWNVSSGDASGKPIGWEKIMSNVVNGCKVQNQCVVLMHDLANKIPTYEALEPMITQLKELGYRFDVLTTSTNPVQHRTK